MVGFKGCKETNTYKFFKGCLGIFNGFHEFKCGIGEGNKKYSRSH
jgi:hypothetical protein